MSYILSTSTDRTHVIGPAFAHDVAAQALSNIQQFRPHIQHLTDLRLSLRFLPLCIGVAFELPAVIALTLVANPEHDGDSAYNMPASASSMIVPALRSLSFACRSGYSFGRHALQWFFVTLSWKLRQWLSYDAEKLDVLSLEGAVSKTALKKVNYRQSIIYSLAVETRIDPSAGVQ
ncbi:hypothetical protein AURDEDRAFT_114259 [Auricularia subglabra TFB-10046 SS5]|nr:hypothetical protein AURDEDRAFT_114259 [Auricularia subglabra TFB-10046 SS5]